MSETREHVSRGIGAGPDAETAGITPMNGAETDPKIHSLRELIPGDARQHK